MCGDLVLSRKRGKAAQGRDAGAADGFVQALAIGRQLRAIVPWMPKVKNAGGKSPILAAYAGAHQTNGQIGILIAPADKAVVEAIDAVEIAARHREVAGLRAAPAFFLQLAQRAQWQMHRRQQTIDAAAQALARESAERPGVRCEPVRQNGRGQFARQQNAIADHEPARLIKPPVGGNKIRPGQAIAVEENAQRALARPNAAIANLAAAKAAVFVTDMLDRDRQARFPVLNKARRLGS